MASCLDIDTKRNQTVGMGQIVIGQNPARLTAVLGSCIGLTFHHKRLRWGALAHVVLPNSFGKPGGPGKFADTAITYMLEQFRRRGIEPSMLSAKLVGGACMFGLAGPMQIGQSNDKAIVQALGEARVPIVAKDVGGTSGRRITFDCKSGTITVETVGYPPRVL